MAIVHGVYCIENTRNGNKYIGSSLNVPNRFLEHAKRLNSNTHPNRHLQFSWNKYGRNIFKFSLIVECELFELLRYEQGLIDTIDPEYNICKIAGSRLGTKMSEDVKLRLSLAHLGKTLSDDTKVKLSIAGRGRPVSDVTRKKISLAHAGMKHSAATLLRMSESHHFPRNPLPDETKQKIACALRGRKRPASVIMKMSLANKGKPWTRNRRLAQVKS